MDIVGKKSHHIETLGGELKYWDPFRGYQDFFIDHEGFLDIFSTRNLNNSIAELEELHKQGGTDPIIFPTPPDIYISFLKKFNTEVGPQYVFVATPRIKAILETVRNRILEWSLKLEEDGILGEDLQFTIKEIEIAEEKSSMYNTMIKDSVVQIGDGNVQNVNQINLDDVSDLLKSIKDSLDDLGLNSIQTNELEIGMGTIESQISLKQPNQVIIKESLLSIKNILEGCAGSLIASGLLFEVTKLIGS